MDEAARPERDDQDNPVVIWEPQPRQQAFIDCPVFEVLYGGARGGGKTDAVLGEFAEHAARYGEHAIGLMVRRERTQLIETIERSRVIYTPLGATFQETEKMWRFPNGARLRFAYLERDSDADNYQGHSYTRVYVEEIGTFPDPKPIMKLLATLRSGAGVPCGFRATANPGGPGHSWVKQRYIEWAPGGWQVKIEKIKNPWTNETIERDRVFIPSRLSENKYLGSDYVANLQMLGSPTLVKAWLMGDWNVIEGAFFDCWDTERHTCAPFAIPGHWVRLRSGDWGSAKPFAILWAAVVSEDMRSDDGFVLPRGALVVYREWYGSAANNNTGLKLDAEEVATGRALQEYAHIPWQQLTPDQLEFLGILQREEGEEISNAVLDPAGFARDGGPSIAERMIVRGVMWRPADNKRVAQKGAIGGWDQVRHRLVGQGLRRPMIVIFDTCVNLIRTLPALQHDTDKPEDVDTDAEDHAPDALRYLCMSRPWAAESPKEPEPLKDWRTSSLNELWDEAVRKRRRYEDA